MAKVMWQAMDDDSSDLAELHNLDKGMDKYKELKTWITNRFERLNNRSGAKKAGSSKLASMQEGDAQEENQQNDWGTGYGSTDNTNTIDSTKGGGGGGGKGGGGIKCHRCGGTGHPQRLCPSADPPAEHLCFGCGGKGHFGRECPSKGAQKGQGQKGYSTKGYSLNGQI